MSKLAYKRVDQQNAPCVVDVMPNMHGKARVNSINGLISKAVSNTSHLALRRASRYAPQALLLSALSLMPLLAQADAPYMGRLFMSPQERTELDRLRLGGAPKAIGETQRNAPEENLTVDGYVRRNGSGKSTVWVNAQPQYRSGQSPESLAASGQRSTNGVAVQLPSGRQVHLKAGQSIDIATGQIREGYEQGVVVSGSSSKPDTTDKP